MPFEQQAYSIEGDRDMWNMVMDKTPQLEDTSKVMIIALGNREVTSGVPNPQYYFHNTGT